jgi:DNA polymerase-3 subunit gamma/tau
VTFYLKYRPQTVDELDLDFVREQLAHVLSSKSLPHAFLFSGPRGLGKTSAARILAKMINCQSKTKAKPCNKCQACESITAGTAMDLIEIDAASNRGIDDIRALRQTINLAPSSFKYKVYVIDEVHMLTPEAFNALLKTLEEPPAHAIFVLATTEPQKLPATIISRCLEIRFQKAGQKELIRSLRRIVSGEKLEADQGVLELIASQADGSFRDGVKILEQLSYENKKISLQMVQNFLTQGGNFELTKWLDFVLAKDVQKSIQMLGSAVQIGIDLKWLVVQSLKRLRQLLLSVHGLVDKKEEDWYKEWSKKVTPVELLELINLFSLAGAELARALIPQLPLELAIIKWAGNDNIKYQKSNIKNNNDDKKDESLKRHAVRQLADSTSFSSTSLKIQKQVRDDKSLVSSDQKTSPEIIKKDDRKKLKTKFEDVIKNWDKILHNLRPHNNSIEALLRSTRPIQLDGHTLTIEVFYQFHKERLENGNCPTIIAKILKDIFGENIKIKCILGQKKPVSRKEENIAAEEELGKAAEEIFLSK